VIEIDVDDGVATVALARPELRNALSSALVRELSDVFARVQLDPAVRVVVLTGKGKAFSAGADLDAMRAAAHAGAEANRADALELGGLFHRIASLSKPTVARVAGPAIGGGVGLLAACDVVVASDAAFFQFSEVRLGLVPAVISPFCIRRLGPAVAKRLFLTAERFSADVALRLGLVDVVATAGDLDAAVTRVCADLLLGGPEALAAAKQLVDAVAGREPQEALADTADRIARLRASEEGQEGMSAFLEKRGPSWSRGPSRSS